MATTTGATSLRPKQTNRKKMKKNTEKMEVDTIEENKMELKGNWKVADVDYSALKLDELGHFLGIEELRMDDEVFIGKPTGARNKSRRKRRHQRKIFSQLVQNPLKRKDSPLEDDQAAEQKRPKMHPSRKSSVLTFDTEKKKTPKVSKKKEKRETKPRSQDKEDGDKTKKDDDEVAANSKMRKNVAGGQKGKKTSTSFTKGIPIISNKNSSMSMSAWKNLQIPAPVLQALRDLGFQEPTPIQKATIPLAIQDQKDIIGAAETGSGKTLAFGIPVIHKILQYKAARQREARAKAFRETNMGTVIKTKPATVPKGMKVKELTSRVPKSSKASEKLSTNPPAGQNKKVKRKTSAEMQSNDEEGEIMFRERESDEEDEEEEDLETRDFDFGEEDDEEDEDIEYDFDDEDDDDEEGDDPEDIEFEDDGDEGEDDEDDFDEDGDDDDDIDDDIDYDSDESDSDSADSDDEEDDEDSSDDDDSDSDNQKKASNKPQNKHPEENPKETDQPGEPKKRPKGKKGQKKRRFKIQERKMLELDGAEFEGVELINKAKKRGIGCVRAIDDISEEEMLAQLGSNETIKTIKADPGPSSDDDRQLYAMIMTPTRELAVQIKNHLVNITKYTDLQVAVIVGGMSAQKQERVLKKRPEIVVGTPGRIWELFREGEPHLSTMSGARCLVLDEADRMIEKGHYKELTQIIQQLNHSPASLERQTFVFSATLTLVHLGPDRKVAANQANKKNNPKQDKKDRKAKLNALIKRVGIREDPAIVDLTQKEGTVASLMEAKIISDVTDKDIYLFYFLLQFPGRTLVFTNSIDCIRRLCSILTLLSCNPLPLHSLMHQKQRLKNLDRFASNPKALLLATDVAARGLDIPDVQHVIHYQMPRTSETYIHRSGRTARQSKEGISVMLVAPTEANFYRRVCKTLNRDDIPSFPVDHSFYNAVKQRVDLARLIDQTSHSVSKKKHTNDWFIKAAKELDIDLDEDLVLHDLGDSHEQMHREKKLQHMKGDLKRLLQQNIFPRGSSGRYPTAPGKLISALTQGPSNALALVKNKPGNMLKLESREATSQPKKAKRCRNKFKMAEAEKAP